MKKSRWRHLKNKWVIIGLIIVVIVAGYYFTHRGSAPTFQSTAATIGNVMEQVSVTGTVSPVDKAALSFEKSGVVSRIYMKVGDIVKAGDPIATLDSANDAAALASAQATLADLSRSLTPQELAVQQTALANAEKDALNAAHDGYVKAQGAIFNYTDTFFTNPQSANPVINVRTQSANIQLAIDNERVSITDVLNQWSVELAASNNAVGSSAAGSGANAADPVKLTSDSRSYLTTIKVFMNDLSAIVNDLNPGNSGLAQQQIDTGVAAMNNGLSGLNTAIDSVTAAETELSTAQSDYDLKLSGNSSQSIAAQAAKVAQAQAQLDEDTITSPIDGIITQEDPNVGEFAAAGQSGFSVENSGFKVEAFVPEADIAKVAVGDMASSTLDAYGSYVDFPAKVTMIDPAETVLEGVPTYKVTLQFIAPDARIRSGMTANLEILTHEASGVLEIPYRAIAVTSTSTTVRLVGKDGKSYKAVPIVTGLKGSDGTIEVVSGLNPGDKVVTYVTGQ
jgi:HlyD family secretion protein